MADTNITARFFPNPVPQFFATDGTPAAGYKLFHFTTGTTEDKDIWTEEVDSSDTDSKHAQPIVLNSRGEVPGGMFGYGKYTFMLIPPTGPEDDYSDAIWTINDVDVLTIQDYIRDTLFACANAAAVRTALELEDAAQLDANQGVAGNVVVYDDDGRYPAEDGRNIENVATVVSGSWTPAPPYPYQHMSPSGFAISMTTTTITVSTGSCRSDDNAENIDLTSAMTKSQSTWAEGSTAGGLQSGSGMSNDTWYDVYVIKDTVDGTVDVQFLPHSGTFVYPTGLDYAAKRYIGSVMTNPSDTNWRLYTQYGDQVLWDEPIMAIDAAGSGNYTADDNQSFDLKYVPDGYNVKARINVYADTVSVETEMAWVFSKNISTTWADANPIESGNPVDRSTPIGTFLLGTEKQHARGALEMWTETDQTIYFRCTSNAEVYIAVEGWTYKPGRA